MPFFSIVIPLYNKQKDIAATLRSVFAQTFADFEVVVINDGSTDGSENEVLQFDDNRIVYIKTENRGVSQARNLGIENSKGEYIAFLDADDYWFPGHLETLHQLITEYSEAGLFTSNYRFAYPNGTLVDTDFSSLGSNFSGIVENVFKHSLKNRLMWTSCVVVKSEVFDIVGMFDTSITLGAGEDTDMWIRVALKYPVAHTSRVTAHYNLAGSNRVSHAKTLQRSFAKLDKFTEEESIDPYLKKFIDLYRSVYALAHKMAGDKKTAKFYLKSLNENSIPAKSVLLLKMPSFILRILFRVKHLLKKANIHLDPYN